MPAGRPTKLTPDMTKRLCEAIKLGMSRERAAWFVGINRDTLQRWLKSAEGRTRGKYREFSDSLKKAESEAIAINLKHLHTAAQDGAWQAAAWQLERRYPKEYGRNQTGEETGTAMALAQALKMLRGDQDGGSNADE